MSSRCSMHASCWRTAFPLFHSHTFSISLTLTLPSLSHTLPLYHVHAHAVVLLYSIYKRVTLLSRPSPPASSPRRRGQCARSPRSTHVFSMKTRRFPAKTTGTHNKIVIATRLKYSILRLTSGNHTLPDVEYTVPPPFHDNNIDKRCIQPPIYVVFRCTYVFEHRHFFIFDRRL